METIDDYIKAAKLRDLSIGGSDELIDFGNELDVDHFLKEEFIDFIKEEPGEDPLSEFVKSASCGVEDDNLFCYDPFQEERLVEFTIKNDPDDIDVLAISSSPRESVIEHEKSCHVGFDRVFKKELDENHCHGSCSQPEPKKLFANLDHTEFRPKSTSEEVDLSYSVNECQLEQSTLNDSLRPCGVEEQEIVVNAVDAWLRRLEVHGPVGDNEILDAAHQLARNFNINFSPDLKWLMDLKIRLGICRSECLDLGAKRKQTGASAEALQRPEHPEPTEKRVRDEGRLDEILSEPEKPPTANSSANSSAKQFLSTSDIQKLINQLVFSHGLSRDQAVHWLNQFMAQLITWVISESASRKLGIFTVRLKVASLAKKMGKSGFTLEDEFYIKMKQHRPDFFKDLDKKGSRTSWNSLWDKVAEWYDEEASKRSVSPGELERKAFEVGEGREVSPRDFYRKFMGHYGIYCDINGKRTLFRKPSGGLLRCRFEIVYVKWYYDWPTDIDHVIVRGCYFDGSCWVILKRYMAALTEWYLELPPNIELTPAMIATQELRLAKVMCTPEVKMDVWKTWGKTWIEETTRILIGIRYFSSALEAWCKNSLSVSEPPTKHLFTIPRWTLQRKACEIAKSKGIPFQPTKSWFKSWLIRVFECNGYCFSESTLLKDPEEFELAFELWYQETGNVIRSMMTSEHTDHTQRFSKIVNELKQWYLVQRQAGRVRFECLKRMAEGIACRKGLVEFKATTAWIRSFVDSLELSSSVIRSVSGSQYVDSSSQASASSSQTANSSSQAAASSCRAATPSSGTAASSSQAAASSSQVAASSSKAAAFSKKVYSKSNKVCAKPQTKAFINAAISQWYINESLVRTVLPGELERRCAGIVEKYNIEKSVKYCLQQLISQLGLCLVGDGIRSMLKKTPVGFTRKLFEVEFLVWYHQWPLTTEDMMREDCTFVSKLGEKRKLDFKHFKTALIKGYAEEPNATGYRAMEIERQVVDDLIESGMRGLMKWSREMSDIVKVIVEYNAIMVWRYRRHLNIWQTPNEIIDLAEETAQTLWLRNFRASKSWLKRFVEVNGLRLMKYENGKVRWTLLTADDILRIDIRVFEEMFDAWWNQEYYLGNLDHVDSYDWVEVKLGAHIQQLHSTMVPRIPVFS